MPAVEEIAQSVHAKLTDRATMADIRDTNQRELMGSGSLVERSIGKLCLLASRVVAPLAVRYDNIAPQRETGIDND